MEVAFEQSCPYLIEIHEPELPHSRSQQEMRRVATDPLQCAL